MAVLLNKTTGKDEKEQPAPQSGGASAALAAPPGPGGQPAAQPKASGFTNIQKYIAANKGAGEKLAGRIGQDVERSEGEVNKAVQDTGTFGNQIQAEKDRIAQASGFAQQLGQDPTQLTADPNKLNAFTQLRTGQTAAGNIQQGGQAAFDTAQNKLNTLNQQAQLVGTEPGRFQMLQQALGRPTYNKGQQRLDQLLVQSGGGGVLGNLQKQATNAAQQATGTLGTAQQGFQTGLGEVGTQAEAAKQQLLGALGGLDDPNTPDVDESKGAFGGLQQGLRTKQQEFINQNQTLKDAIQSGLGGENSLYKDQFSSDALRSLGLTQGQSLYDLNLAELVQPKFERGMVTEQSVATPEQLARYNALASLSGSNPSYLNSQQVGTAQGLQVDPTQLQEALGRAQTRAADEFKQIQQSPWANQQTGAGWSPDIFSQGKDAMGTAEAIKALENQYGANLYGGRTPELNAYHKQLVDWANKHLNQANRRVQTRGTGGV